MQSMMKLCLSRFWSERNEIKIIQNIFVYCSFFLLGWQRQQLHTIGDTYIVDSIVDCIHVINNGLHDTKHRYFYPNHSHITPGSNRHTIVSQHSVVRPYTFTICEVIWSFWTVQICDCLLLFPCCPVLVFAWTPPFEYPCPPPFECEYLKSDSSEAKCISNVCTIKHFPIDT